MSEMKAYIGGDEQTEIAQKTRGFKTYRDYYNKKIMEHEHQNLALKENLRAATEKHEPNMHQKQMFIGVKRLLELKMQCNEHAIAGQKEQEQVTQDRLFL
jgi:intraflagellar transport protein 81